MQQNKQNAIGEVVGITGFSGSGTSTVAKILTDVGGFVIEADKIAHEVMQKDKPAYNDIVSFFGTDIIMDNGEINRRILAAIVFTDKCKLDTLQHIVHPHVVAKTKELISDRQTLNECTFYVIDAPLLFESGMDSLCDRCWVITAPKETRLQRIMARDNISLDEAELRLKNRLPEEELFKLANVVIKNDGDLNNLRYDVISKHGRLTT